MFCDGHVLLKIIVLLMRNYNCLAQFLPRLSAIPRAGAMRQGAYLIYREHCTVLPINWYAPLAHFLPRVSAIPCAGAMRQGAYLIYREHCSYHRLWMVCRCMEFAYKSEMLKHLNHLLNFMLVICIERPSTPRANATNCLEWGCLEFQLEFYPVAMQPTVP